MWINIDLFFERLARNANMMNESKWNLVNLIAVKYM